jgi:mitochondrial fission process protein 1
MIMNSSSQSSPPPDNSRDQSAKTIYNPFRHSLLRYAGYANEVGEAFRYQLPRFVLPSYGIAIAYTCADSIWAGASAYNQTNLSTNATTCHNQQTIQVNAKNIVQQNDMHNTNGNKQANHDTDTTNVYSNPRSLALQATLDALIWQSLASVAIPGFTINTIVKLARWTVSRPSLHRMVTPALAKWTPTATGLAAIPFIVHPIDQLVDNFMDATIRKWWQR